MVRSAGHCWAVLAAAAVVAVSAAEAAPASKAPKPSKASTEVTVDLDGDGSPEVVRIGQRGEVSVSSTSGAAIEKSKALAPADAAWAGGWVSARRLRGTALVVGRIDFKNGGRRGSVGAVYEYRAGKLSLLWSGALGALGSDGDGARDLALWSGGAVSFERRGGIRRCDGKPTYLFARGFDRNKGVFRTISLSPAIDSSAPTLTASTALPPFIAATSALKVAPAVFASTVASSQAGASDARDLTRPLEVDDGDIKTAWIDGNSGFGRGEFLTFRNRLDGDGIRAIRIVPGHAGDAARWRASNRLRRVGLLVGSRAFWIDFPADPGKQPAGTAYWVTLPEPIAATCVSLVIDQVYRGRGAPKGGGDTAIAEVAILTELDLAPGGVEAVLAERIATDRPGARRAAKLLSKRPGAEAALVAAIAKRSGDGAAVLRLQRALAAIPASPGQLVAALSEPGLEPADARLFERSLIALGAAAVDPLAAVLLDGQRHERARVRAAKALGQAPASETLVDALIRAAGQGSRVLRVAVSRAIGNHGASLRMVMTKSAAVRDAKRSADVWRGVGLGLARANDAALVAEINASLVARLGEFTDYERLYAVLEAAANGDANTVAAVGAFVARTSESTTPEAVALRRVAVGAMARNGSAAASKVLLSALGDRDPGVRTRAVRGLSTEAGGRADEREVDRALGGLLGKDAWPFVRRDIAGGLSARCQRADAARALYKAVADDRSINVRRTSLSALVACKARGVRERLVQLAGSAKTPFKLREHAVVLIGALADSTLAPALIRLLERFRADAWAKPASVKLAVATALSMCKVGDNAVIGPLLDAAEDSSFSEIQSAAVRSLGCYCPREAAPLFRQLRRSGVQAVKVTARAAQTRCRRKVQRDRDR